MYGKMVNWKCVLGDKLVDGTKLKKNQLKSLVKLFDWLAEELKLQGKDEDVVEMAVQSSALASQGLKNKHLSKVDELTFLNLTLEKGMALVPNEKFKEARERTLRNLHSVRVDVEHLLVCDLEMTCDEGVEAFPSETLDVGMVVLDARTLEEVDRFESLVRPVVTPVLTEFCTKLTGLTQAMVENEREYPEVAEDLRQFVSKYPSSRFVQWGSGDARQLEKDDARNDLEPTLCGVTPFNLKEAFAKFKGSKTQYGLLRVMQLLQLERYGQAHRAFSDAMDTAAVARHLFKQVELELCQE